MLRRLLIYMGFGVVVFTILLNVGVAIFESLNPPHDAHVWGLLAAMMLYYGLPLAALFLALGFLLNR